MKRAILLFTVPKGLRALSITCTPDVGVPLPGDPGPLFMSETLTAACKTLQQLRDEGLKMDDPDADDVGVAARIVESFAQSEDNPPDNKEVVKVISGTSPSALLLVRALLAQYSHAVVEHAVQLRHLVTNRLILESDNPDPKIRLRALELLGKVSDVGLFTERSEVVITHQSDSELESRLREKLAKLIEHNPEGYEDVDVVELGGARINVADELGVHDRLFDPPDTPTP